MMALATMALSQANAQQPLGAVSVADANVAGALEVSNGRAMLVGNATITAKDHPAEVALSRGGSVKVCSTSGFHLTGSRSSSSQEPLILALDRGALEIRMNVMTSDLIMTPDLRFSATATGPLDLRIRVTPNGDTCVENRGAAAPVLHIADQFGEASYELHAEQHVLFEHGSLREVVDRESSPCGCPPQPTVSVADAGVSGSADHAATPGSAVAKSAEEHPFPAAVSAGLAPAPAVPQAPQGVVHAQVATTMSYGAGDSSGAPSATAANANTPAASNNEGTPATTAQAPPPPSSPPPSGILHSIGRFFKHLFGGH